MLRALLLIAAVSLIAGPALAQDRTQAQRDDLLDLSYVMGQSHAYRQACEGEDDQFWRSRMLDLVATEQADAAFEARLKDEFNTGYHAAQQNAPTCAASRPAAQAAAKRGAALSARLAAAPAPLPELH